MSDYDKSLHRHDKNRRMCHCESKIYSQQSLVYATRTKIELKLLLVSKKLYNIKTKTKLNFRTKIGLVTTGAIRRAKLQSNHHHPTNQHPVFFTDRMPFLSPNQHRQSTEGKISHSKDLLTQSSPEGLPTLSLTTKEEEEDFA